MGKLQNGISITSRKELAISSSFLHVHEKHLWHCKVQLFELLTKNQHTRPTLYHTHADKPHPYTWSSHTKEKWNVINALWKTNWVSKEWRCAFILVDWWCTSKQHATEFIDQYISAMLPDPAEDPELHAVAGWQVHSTCFLLYCTHP